MKIEKVTDVVNNPEHPIMQEVMNSLEGNKGDTVACKNCGKEYIRDVWNFYDLCDPCFSEFDRQKTKERWEFINNMMNNEDNNQSL